ncbi:MAG: type IV secretion system protein, partial [Chloroflexota bacterium]|nr:type IV secretion system protein [Chloroflexota bacterium]
GAGAGLTELLGDPAGWASAVFNGALVGLGHRTTSDMVSFLDGLLGQGNVISQTPPALSYDSAVVRRLWSTLRTVANIGLAVVTVWGGINLIVHPHIRAPYHGALELVPRVLVGAVLVNTSLDWGRFAIDANNALCGMLGLATIPGWVDVLGVEQGSVLLNVIAMGIYLLMGLLLLGQMLMRLALVDALLVVAPLALLCWVLPQTHSWARLWFSTFFSTVFVQFLQVVVLQLGTELLQSAATALQAATQQPLGSGRSWLASVLFGVAVLHLARKVPRLMPGHPGASSGWTPIQAFTSRQLVSLVAGLRGRRGEV